MVDAHPHDAAQTHPGDPWDAPWPHASYTLDVNGRGLQVADVWLGESLLGVLRDQLGLTGAKDGCGEGVCGSCTVLLDGVAVAACLVPAATVGARPVTTVEGLAEPGAATDVQQALVDGSAVQCGHCIPGLVMSAHALFSVDPAPDRDTLRQVVAGHPCRCAGPSRALDALCALAGHGGDDGTCPGPSATPPPGAAATGVGTGGASDTGLLPVPQPVPSSSEVAPRPAPETAASTGEVPAVDESGAWPVVRVSLPRPSPPPEADLADPADVPGSTVLVPPPPPVPPVDGTSAGTSDTARWDTLPHQEPATADQQSGLWPVADLLATAAVTGPPAAPPTDRTPAWGVPGVFPGEAQPHPAPPGYPAVGATGPGHPEAYPDATTADASGFWSVAALRDLDQSAGGDPPTAELPRITAVPPPPSQPPGGAPAGHG